MGRVFLFSLTAALNPTLLAASTLMLLLDRPARLMLGYLLGALLTSITLGLVIVFSLQGTAAVDATQHGVNPAVDLALGGLAIVAAAVLRVRSADGNGEHHRRRRRDHRQTRPPRWQRALSKGSPRTTFVVGALLTLPGASYLAGLHEIHVLGRSDLVTVLLVVGFNLIMLALLEIPLVSFAVAPKWTPAALERAKAWIGRRGRRLAVRGLVLVGVALLIKGLAGLLA